MAMSHLQKALEACVTALRASTHVLVFGCVVLSGTENRSHDITSGRASTQDLVRCWHERSRRPKFAVRMCIASRPTIVWVHCWSMTQPSLSRRLSYIHCFLLRPVRTMSRLLVALMNECNPK